ncbi:hypothetical protein B566_EDAN013861 [Ephemera danica]|nr:hypothetical protein B566_EDAN013861 [Ephemera danica]
MTDLFKSAMGYFSSANSSSTSQGHEFVGHIVEVGNVKLRVKKLIAEGGFALVFIAQDPNTGNEYALKRLMAADDEANKNIIQEINVLFEYASLTIAQRKLSGHPHIIQFLAAAQIDKSKTSHGMTEYLLVTELCTVVSLYKSLTH